MRSPELEIEHLASIVDVFDFSPSLEESFARAILEAARFHFSGSGVFQRLCWECHLDGIENRTPLDYLSIPHIAMHNFEEVKLLSMAETEVSQISARTGENRYYVYYDSDSQRRVRTCLQNYLHCLDLLSSNPHVTVAVPEPGLTKFEELVNGFLLDLTPSIPFTGNETCDSSPENARLAACEKIKFAIENSKPVRLAGRIEKFLELILTMRTLPEVGYDGPVEFANRSIFFRYVSWPYEEKKGTPAPENLTGISGLEFRDVLSLPPQGLVFTACKEGNFHIPVYARLFILDPVSRISLPYNTPGLLLSICPVVRSMPVLSMLVVGYAKKNISCPCGIEGEYFRPLFPDEVDT